MKNFLVVLIAMLMAGCAGTGGMRSSGSSGDSGSGYSSGECTGANMNDPACIYFPNFSPPVSPAFKGTDPSFQPYFGG